MHHLMMNIPETAFHAWFICRVAAKLVTAAMQCKACEPELPERVLWIDCQDVKVYEVA